MAFFIPSEARIAHLITTFGEGGQQEAMITQKGDFHHYTTELEDIGPMYVMDDFGNAIVVEMNMLQQMFFIYPPLNVLT